MKHNNTKQLYSTDQMVWGQTIHSVHHWYQRGFVGFFDLLHIWEWMASELTTEKN